MLSGFDWLRRGRTGAELLATLRYLSEHPAVSTDRTQIGAPHSATGGPCRRCWIYPQMQDREQYCKTCSEILQRTHGLAAASRRAAILWGFVNQLPGEILQWEGKNRKQRLLGSYIHDANHFLVAMERRELKSWLQDLTVYHGFELRGILQIFPTTGAGTRTCMGDVLCKAVHRDLYLPMGQMHVRFYSAPYQLLKPRLRDLKGMLTFELAEFLRLLEMAEIFRALLWPDEQRELHELLSIVEKKESQFYWGRFLGRLEQRSRDMLTAWNIRQWPKNRINVFYELLNYVRLIQEN